MPAPDVAFGITAIVGGITATLAKDVGIPEYKVDEQETTTHDNVNRYKTFKPGLIEAGDLKFETLFNPATYISLEGLVSTLTEQTLTITLPTLPSSTRIVCSGFINAIQMGSGKVGELYEGSFGWKISGKPTVSAV
jgi:hypothetical protein